MDKKVKYWTCILIITLAATSSAPVLSLIFAVPVPLLLSVGIPTAIIILYKLRKKISKLGLTISTVAVVWSFVWLIIWLRIAWLMERGLFP